MGFSATETRERGRIILRCPVRLSEDLALYFLLDIVQGENHTNESQIYRAQKLQKQTRRKFSGRNALVKFLFIVAGRVQENRPLIGNLTFATVVSRG